MVPDINEDFLKQTTQGIDHYQLTQLLGFESYVSVPLLTDDKAIGALTLVTAGSGRTIRNEELVLAEELQLRLPRSSIELGCLMSSPPSRDICRAASFLKASTGAPILPSQFDTYRVQGERKSEATSMT